MSDQSRVPRYHCPASNDAAIEGGKSEARNQKPETRNHSLNVYRAFQLYFHPIRLGVTYYFPSSINSFHNLPPIFFQSTLPYTTEINTQKQTHSQQKSYLVLLTSSQHNLTHKQACLTTTTTTPHQATVYVHVKLTPQVPAHAHLQR